MLNPRRADPHTIQDKFLVGYQGWFTCPGDGPPLDPNHHGWLHWLTEPIPAGGRPNTDLWPDVSAYSPSELFPVPGLRMADGSEPLLFSSRNAQTVRRHFRWMAEAGVDGAFLQRFVGQCDLERGNRAIRDQRDEVGDRVREAAEAEGRVFAIMYDVTDVPLERIHDVITRDWQHLVREKRILDSPNYLREKGRPVISIWGLGFDGRPYTPHTARAILHILRTSTPGGAYLIGGAPAHWRTGRPGSDADPNPAWIDLWTDEFDAISPWTIGRYGDEQGADQFAEEKVKLDMEHIQKKNEEWERAGKTKRVDYMPVVFPGGSGFNLSEGKWGFNDIKRNGGRFLWRQIFNVKHHGVRMIYGAMWDEYDEGTAFLPVVAHKRQLPQSDRWPFLALDAEGHDLPTDWYMRIAGLAAEGLRGERQIHDTFPVKELQDFWSSRPHYEDEAQSSASGSGSGSGSGDDAGKAYQDWLASQAKSDGDEPPPPPYTLEAEPTQPHEHSQPPPAPASTRPRPPAVPPRNPSQVQDPVTSLASELQSTSISVSASFSSSRPPPVPSGRPTSPSIAVHFRPEQTYPQHLSSNGEGHGGQWEQVQWPPPNWHPSPAQYDPTSPAGPTAPLRPRPSQSRPVSGGFDTVSTTAPLHPRPSQSRPVSGGFDHNSTTAPLRPHPSSRPLSVNHDPASATGPPPPHASSRPVSGNPDPGPSNVPPINLAARPSLSHPHSQPGGPPPPPLRPRPSISGSPGVHTSAPSPPPLQPQPYAPYAPPEPHPYLYNGQGYTPQYPSPPLGFGGPGTPYSDPEPGPGAAGFYGGFPQAMPFSQPSSPPPGGNSPYQSYAGYGSPPQPHSPPPNAYYSQPQPQLPPPPRPYNAPAGSSGSMPAPAPLLSSAPVGYALNAIGSVAGQGTRRQIEKGVDSLAQTGSKIFGRFTR
ncbi:hypothetical protein PUNSTDRAFT_128983 [Punctularia strigosozonata HHB-11173 SS5]|uniref:uncharacterized protein n=1 Tax=Punctularia strigosozonata (strain HHB-11173) TaxID=741275 RepID=UPI000441816C|nr:uncharacterized protein PUNSTDRAFT_128983 [Punctularia strigosozonata HHB-11173 SS5]EIN13295.1 hypothetical protein PUNSTDRAFT_128983 [Punctularia strigosozonata HHB-11173 SS5]